MRDHVTQSVIPESRTATANTATRDGTDAIYTFRIGDFAAMAIADGTARLPGWPLWSTNVSEADFRAAERQFHLDADAVRIDCVSLLIDTGRDRVLIDPGAGPSLGAGYGGLATRLRNAGVEAESITTVIISHGHNDHFHGLIAEDGALRFPNARIVWSETEWRYWADDDDRGLRDFRNLPLPGEVHQSQAASLRAVLPRLHKNLELLSGNGEVTSGIRLLPAPGHTPAQSGVLVHSGLSQLLCRRRPSSHNKQLRTPRLDTRLRSPT